MNNFKKTSTILIILILAMLTACIVSFIMLCIQGADPFILTHKKEADKSPPAPSELAETFDYGEGYLKSIVFIGDKTITPISDVVPYVPKDQIWTGTGGSLQLAYATASATVVTGNEESMSIPAAIEKYKPQYVVLTLGLENGVDHCTEEKFKEYYEKLIVTIKDASPETKIILQSIFPVSKQAEKNDPSISNDRIDTANKYISELAQKLSVKFLNTAEVLKNSNGCLDEIYASDDGITLNEEGYRAVESYIRTHGYK